MDSSGASRLEFECVQLGLIEHLFIVAIHAALVVLLHPLRALLIDFRDRGKLGDSLIRKLPERVQVIHAEYPRALREIPDPPGLLFIRGTLKPADALGIGIVGTRHGTAY